MGSITSAALRVQGRVSASNCGSRGFAFHYQSRYRKNFLFPDLFAAARFTAFEANVRCGSTGYFIGLFLVCGRRPLLGRLCYFRTAAGRLFGNSYFPLKLWSRYASAARYFTAFVLSDKSSAWTILFM